MVEESANGTAGGVKQFSWLIALAQPKVGFISGLKVPPKKVLNGSLLKKIQVWDNSIDR